MVCFVVSGEKFSNHSPSFFQILFAPPSVCRQFHVTIHQAAEKENEEEERKENEGEVLDHLDVSGFNPLPCFNL